MTHDQKIAIALLVFVLVGWALKVWQWRRHLKKHTDGIPLPDPQPKAPSGTGGGEQR